MRVLCCVTAAVIEAATPQAPMRWPVPTVATTPFVSERQRNTTQSAPWRCSERQRKNKVLRAHQCSTLGRITSGAAVVSASDLKTPFDSIFVRWN